MGNILVIIQKLL